MIHPVEKAAPRAEREVYATAVSEVWERVGAALARLERIASTPAEWDDDLAAELPPLQYALHAGAELAHGIRPPSAAAAAPRDYGPNAPPVRYPEPDVVVLDKRFAKYKIGNTPIRRLHTGMLWAEGPAWNGVGKYLVWSDIPNNIQHRWLMDDGHVSVFRNPANYSNGNTFDWEGRQISFEHGTRRVARYEYNGTVTVLAEKFNGKPFNAPNDGAVHPDGSVWFTDPGYDEGEFPIPCGWEPWPTDNTYSYVPLRVFGPGSYQVSGPNSINTNNKTVSFNNVQGLLVLGLYPVPQNPNRTSEATILTWSTSCVMTQTDHSPGLANWKLTPSVVKVG